VALLWIKMWLEALDDLKLIRLSLAERGAWWALLKLAGKCNADGKIISGGLGLGIEDICDALHIKTGEDRSSVESMIKKMEERGSLKWNGSVLTVVHYEERQRKPPSAQPEAVAARVRQFRDRHKKGELKLHELMDPMLSERQNSRNIEYRKAKAALGRELTTEERLEVWDKLDRRLEKKYGRKFED